MKILFVIVVALFLLYVFAENRLLLCVRREKLGDDIKIAHIADLHKRCFGAENKRIIKRISIEKPDIILISGDLISRSCTDFSSVGILLERLCKIAPVYLVFGNHETDLSTRYKEAFIKAVKRSGAKLINNETIKLDFRGRKLNLCGMELKYSVYKCDNGYDNLDLLTVSDIYDALGEKPEGETLLLVHNPLFADVYEQWGADYAVCGHIHGGAVMIPFTRVGVLSPERTFFPKYSKGIYTVGKMKLLLSGGLGKLRLFNAPEIVIYKI